jgi:hypothetical protein
MFLKPFLFVENMKEYIMNILKFLFFFCFMIIFIS